MHLLLLGLILVVGILVYYIMTTSAGSKGASSDKKKAQKSKGSENLRKEDNVIFLPNADGDSAKNGTSKSADNVSPAEAKGKSADADNVSPDDGEA